MGGLGAIIELAGALALVPGLAAMLSANLGTALILQALSFNIAVLAPTLVLGGVVAFRTGAPIEHSLAMHPVLAALADTPGANMPVAARWATQGVALPQAMLAAIEAIHMRGLKRLQLAAAAFMREDVTAARRLIAATAHPLLGRIGALSPSRPTGQDDEGQRPA